LGLLTLPINLITFGLFSFILNALLFWFVASFVQGFGVAGFVAALLGSVVLTLVSWVIDAAL
jgi:putative membrane protein